MERPIIYTSTAAARDGVSDVGSFFRSVYGWMTVGLGLTAIVALYTVTTPALMQMIFGNKLVFYGLVIGQVGLVIALSAAINRLSATAAVAIRFGSNTAIKKGCPRLRCNPFLFGFCCV